jgi:hypothetical protein
VDAAGGRLDVHDSSSKSHRYMEALLFVILISIIACTAKPESVDICTWNGRMCTLNPRYTLGLPMPTTPLSMCGFVSQLLLTGAHF